MKIKELLETASGGSTSAGMVSVGPVYPNVPGKQPKKRKGIAVNALDLKNVNLLTGGSLLKR